MKAWLADLLWNALLLCSRRLHDWAFDADRHARIRFRHRERWWAYRQKALATMSPHDDMRAKAWQIEFDFKTPPSQALARGDLDQDTRRIAMEAVEATRARMSGKHQP